MIYINNHKIEVSNFPDGTQKINFPTLNFCGRLECSIVWNYENDEELFTVYCITRRLQTQIGVRAKINLILPYIPNARMDRVKEKSDVFTLKYFCEIINSLNFSNVVVLDPHSDVSLALLDNVTQQDVYSYIAATVMDIERHYSNTDLVMFTPDGGAAKRYGDMLNKLSDYPCGFGIKNRDWKTGQILGLTLETNGVDIKDKDILIVDDICSKGGTFYHAAKALKEAGANRIFLYVTHCENTITKGELLKDNGLIEAIYTTDSICTVEDDKITTFSLFVD